MSTPIYFYKAKNLSNLKADSIVAVKNDNESAFSLYITDRSGIPYPLKDLQNNVILTNTDGNLQITSFSTSTNINLTSSILASINSALQNGDNISELINDIGYLTSFTETDPIFQASEASLFVSGDKANLNNQSGVNSGDQTSIAGISGTKAEFNTELTDGDFLFVGDIPAFNPLDYDLDDFTNISADPFARTSELTSGITNLTYTPSATDGIVVSDTGSDATITTVDFTNAGLLTPSEKQLLYNNTSTGVTKFEGFSINIDTTKYNTGLVEGWFIDNITNPNLPTKIFKSFPATTGKSLINISTQNVTYIAIDINGVHQQSSIPFDPEYQRDWIPLGVIVHSNRIFINAINTQPVVAISPNNQLSDLMESIGFFNISGNVFSPNGANLNINKSAGHVFKQGSNFLNNNKDPHTLPLIALTAPNNLRYRTQIGTEFSNTSTIDTVFYDLAGIRTAIPGTRWSIQRIYVFQSNLVRIQYGQATYTTKVEAIQAITTEPFVVEQNILENGLFRGLLIVREATTDLSDTSRALFIEAGRFGSVTGLGSLSTTSLQQAYNNSLTPEITTNSTLGAFTVKRGSILDSDNVVEIQNGTGTITSAITGNGALTALTYNGYTPENIENKQNSLIVDGTGTKYPTVDAINSSNSNINKLTNINHTFVKESKIRESDSNYLYTGSVITVGSGGTYSTITAAFNAASSGDILQLANGVYDTALESGGYLLINSSTKRILIRGNSTDNTLVIIRQSAIATYCVRERTANEVTFQDLTIESNQANATITISMDTASSPVTTLFNNCIIKNTSSSAINTINIIGIPVNNGKYEFRNCDIYQSNNSSSRCLSQSSISDANSVLYYLPILISNSNLFGIISIDGATNLNIYNSSFFTNQNSIILSIGTDTATPAYSKSHIDIRSCYFSFTSTFTNHGVLLGRGTKDIYFINNYIKMLSGNNALSLGLVIKSIASNIDDVIIEGNYVEAPRPYYIKGAQYVSLRYNTGISNWSDNTNGYGFEINNPLNGDGEISSIGNIVESNNFIGNIGAIGLTYNGTTTAFTSFKLCYFKNNKYTIPTNGLYLNTPSVTWENKYTLTKQDSNSILKYY